MKLFQNLLSSQIQAFATAQALPSSSTLSLLFNPLPPPTSPQCISPGPALSRLLAQMSSLACSALVRSENAPQRSCIAPPSLASSALCVRSRPRSRRARLRRSPDCPQSQEHHSCSAQKRAPGRAARRRRVWLLRQLQRWSGSPRGLGERSQSRCAEGEGRRWRAFFLCLWRSADGKSPDDVSTFPFSLCCGIRAGDSARVSRKHANNTELPITHTHRQGGRSVSPREGTDKPSTPRAVVGGTAGTPKTPVNSTIGLKIKGVQVENIVAV